MEQRILAHGRCHPRRPGADPRFGSLLPELVLAVTPEQFAAIAAGALTPRPAPQVTVEHLHTPAVSVAEQARLVTGVLLRRKAASFRALVADADSTLVVVARFLAVLELFRAGSVALDQAEALGELTVRWTGPQEGPAGRGGQPPQPGAQDAAGEPGTDGAPGLAAAGSGPGSRNGQEYGS